MAKKPNRAGRRKPIQEVYRLAHQPEPVSQPWYESGLLWGALGMAVAIVLVVVAAMVKDLRWLLGISWPFFGLSCGFRGKAGTFPKSSRSAFRNEAGHDSGMKPGTDSDFKPVTFGR